MLEWAATGDRVCGYGTRGAVTLDADGWRTGGDAPALPGSVDAAVSGRAEAIRLPDGDATLVGDGRRALRAGELRDGVHRILVESTPETRLSFEGPATVDSGERPWIRFPEPRAVAVGFSETPTPRPVVTVPATPCGLATAVTAAGRTHDADGPARSHPGFRPPTPEVRFGDRSVTAELDGEATGPTMTVPESAAAVLVAAPLAYYLGADLRVGSGPPRISGDELDREFEPLPDFADDAADALRRLVHLDSRLRSIPGEGGSLDDDRTDLASAPPAERLASVLDSPRPTLPEWPLSTYVDDDVANGRYLPYLLDRLSLVHPADASALDPKALLERSLDEFFRGETPNVEAVDPALAESRYHAWLADGTPVDAYTLLRPDSAGLAAGGGLRIDVVCNEPEMASERCVADVYRERLAGRDVDVHVHERLSTADLASVFEGPTDLVHFVGHCEVDGMVCPDGALAAADLDDCGARSFFLNACGSYYEGYDLVRRGATVGAVTLTAVLDEQAVSLGTAFAELLAAGYAFDRALSLARGEIIVGRDYVVVGDGTHRLRAPVGTPGTFSLRETDDGFEVRYEATAPDAAGRRYASPLDGGERLCGESIGATMDRTSVVELLDRVAAPVRYDGALSWSGDLAGRLSRANR
ncbi:hypothetical protein HWV07_19315 [Natronomonas salina]|uniref:hypothetical protein n=1 Tax=Natronomonas salina TaxID=1710540 RepID=UPI0015B40B1D|nr:hypothetical protein [Natronomonas salina]QLD91076.1 hypothetical protein HWV07_19315 [Natronomonas salina]